MQNIGILLPRSTYYNGIAFDMQCGLREGLKKSGADDLRIISENIGFGAEKQPVYRSAEKLLMDDNVEVVLAYVGHRTAQLLRPLFMSANKLLVVLDAGAHLPHEWPVSSNIFYHSLHNSLGAWLAAEWATRDGFKTAGMLTNYFDGGFLHTMAITNGFTHSGGKIGFNIATGYQPVDFSLEALKEHLAAYPDACLLPIFSGDFAEWFFRDIHTLFPDRSLPAYLPPFMLEEQMLKNSVYPGENAKGIAVWSKNLDSEANSEFVAAIKAARREANLFSLLGWEGASLAAHAVHLMNEHNGDARVVAEDLHKFSFLSPRGTITVDAATNNTIAPMYQAKMKDDGSGHSELHITGEAENTLEAWKKIRSLDLGETNSGWFNSYVCN
jgi:branched-chain amino acid transport system substrate-binding protein